MNSVRLADLTTLRLGGPARQLRRCATTESVVETLRACDAAGEDVLVVGGGSNLVVADDGFDGTVVVVESSGLQFDVEDGRHFVRADAGVEWDALVAQTVSAGFGGLECLSGIPGSTGATPVQNVGAYGVEVADALRTVTLYDRRSATTLTVEPSALELGYRTSKLKHRSDQIVVSASYWLNDGGRSAPLRYAELASRMSVAAGSSAEASTVRDAVLQLRRGKGMVLDAADYDTWSSGSFFTNPVVAAADFDAVLAGIERRMGTEVKVPHYPAADGVKLSAGWLIERAGFARGYPGAEAPARLSTKHTLALTNRGAATTEQLLDLARTVRAGVHDAFGVWLTPEPVLVNCAL